MIGVAAFSIIRQSIRKQFLTGLVLLAALASASCAIAEPILVIYWDGSALNTIGPSSGFIIPAGSIYAIDELNGAGLILAAPDPGSPYPSISTPNGITFQIPDSGNVSSIDQNGGSVTVTYNDGATATVNGQYVPPGGSPPPPSPAPAQQLVGPALPPDPSLQAPIQNALQNDPWIPQFLGISGGAFNSALDVYIDIQVPTNNLFDSYTEISPPPPPPTPSGDTDTIIQRLPKTPEPGTLTLICLGLAAAAKRFRRRRA
jgi:hypothetical protein